MSFFKGLSFCSFNADANILIYYGKKEGDIIMISLYVDNFLLVTKNNSLIEWINQCVKDEYNVKDLGKVKIIIG